MNEIVRLILVVCLSLLVLPAAHAAEPAATSPVGRAIAAAVAYGVPAEKADDIVAALRQSLGSSNNEPALYEEAVRLSKAQPKHAAGIVAASIALVPELRTAYKLSAAVATAVKSQSPGIAAAAAKAMPEYAPQIAGRVVRVAPWYAVRITRKVAYAVPEAVETKTLPWRTALLESAVISAAPLINVWSVYGAAYRGAKDAERDNGRNVVAN